MKKNKYSRRDFLKTSLKVGAGLALSPSLSLASENNSKFFIEIQQIGGVDPFQIISPTRISTTVLQSLRGTTSYAPHDGQGELDYGIAPHPKLRSLFNSYGSNIRLTMNTGNALNVSPIRSHEQAQLAMSLGVHSSAYGRKGLPGRLYEKNLIDLIGFGGYRASYNCGTCETPPTVLNSFESYNLDSYNFSSRLGGKNNSKQVANMLKVLANLDLKDRSVSDMESQYRAAQKNMFSAIDEVKRTLTYKTPKHDDYLVVPASLGSSHKAYTAFATKFRNIAQLALRQKVEGTSTKTYCVVPHYGHDLHGDWTSRANTLNTILAEVLKVFFADLIQMGLFNNTVVMTNSDFGRTIKHNGTGSDHGIGCINMIMGGRVNASVYGDMLTQSEMQKYALKENGNAWPRRISRNALMIEVLEDFLGIPGTEAFPEPIYSSIVKPKGGFGLFV